LQIAYKTDFSQQRTLSNHEASETPAMKRADLLQGAAALGLFCAAASSDASASSDTSTAAPLTPPEAGVPVAFLLSDGAVMIDFAGPWEVFQDARVAGRSEPAFRIYTVAQTTAPIAASGGVGLIPQFDLAHAPQPKVVVVPAQSPPTPPVKDWLRAVARRTDVMMSVCTGAFVLAEAGLLDGHNATTHHGSFVTLAMDYPQITVKRGARFVDEGGIATSAGLSAGIDLALHVVERYYGREIARQTAYYMEYAGAGWLNAGSNVAYSKPPPSATGHPLCPVCWMDVDPKGAPASTYMGKQYYFCMPAHKERFDAAPARFLGAV
jgi:putative intracellular protease/amidase/YHS domain-containing protein